MSRDWSRGVLRGTAAATGPVIVKVGGSLLARPGWVGTVRSLLDHVPAPRVVVVGGGPLVDGLRAVDAAEPQPAEFIHRLAIDCMGLTAQLVATALRAPLTERCEADVAATTVLDVPAWLGTDGRYRRLPVGWEVTSDSIAACVAVERRAGLLLAKSVAPPHADLEGLTAAGWVDAFFPTAARPLTWIGWAALE